MNTNRKPTALDFHIGQRIRLARKQAGFSQTDLAGMLSVTFQSVQKWEGADARISAGRLWQIAKATGRSIGFFYAEIPDDIARAIKPLSRAEVTPRSPPKAEASPQTKSHQQPRPA